MKTVLLEVRALEDSFADMRRVVATGQPDSGARISFASFDLLWKTLTPNRLRLLQALTGAGPTGVRELARRLGRDVRGVHADAQALASAGLIDKSEHGKLHFPFDAVHVDFMLKKAA